jgi:single-stranded-DNA-specific exonuclease
MAWRAHGTVLGDFLAGSRGRTIHVVGNLSVNHFNGQSAPQLRILDAAVPR